MKHENQRQNLKNIISQEGGICKRGPSLYKYKISSQNVIPVLNASAVQKLAPFTYAMQLQAQIGITPVKQTYNSFPVAEGWAKEIGAFISTLKKGLISNCLNFYSNASVPTFSQMLLKIL